MVLIDLQKVLSALNLVSSIAKPVPLVGSVISGLVDTAGGVVNASAGASTGALGGLLGGGSNGLIAAANFTANATAITMTAFDVTSSDNSSTVSALDDSGDDSTSASAQDDSCSVTPYTPPSALSLENFADYNSSEALLYRYRQQQSVNLGSWFVQEQWMNPSLFTCASGNKQAEFDVANGWGSVDNARQVLERHWDEWITESDFAYLAGIGINTVRLPIGYWSLGPVYCQGTAFESVSAAYVNSWPRVVRAINWADKYGLGVLVDLHGAPGSQNGQAHSGVSDGQQNLFGNPDNIQLTTNVLMFLAQQLVKVNNVVGIQLLNEPSNVDSLPAFYNQVLATLRQVSPEAASFPFYINDAYDMSRFADYISTRSDFLVLDHHSYFVFGDSTSQEIPANQLTATLQPGQGSLSVQMVSASTEDRRNVVIDEWSCALSDQALINSTDPLGDRRRYCTGQMESYTNATAGYGFWSYKTESCSTDVNWCFTQAVGTTLPSTFFSYPNTTIQALAPSSSSGSGTDGSSDTSFLSFGTASPSDANYSRPTINDWLSTIGAENQDYDDINEALATTEYDSTASSPSVSPSQGQSSMSPPSSTPAPPSVEGGLAQQAFAVGDSDDTVPSSRMAMQPQFGNRKRSLLTSLPQRAFLLSSALQRHRFEARHRRSSVRCESTIIPVRRQSNDLDASNYTPEQTAIAKGYADGWKAAQTFAQFNGSRLGFTGQFISDAMSTMSSEIVSTDQQYYRQWFMKGLADGEVQVVKELAMASISSDQ